jgi:hypothetical protein
MIQDGVPGIYQEASCGTHKKNVAKHIRTPSMKTVNLALLLFSCKYHAPHTITHHASLNVDLSVVGAAAQTRALQKNNPGKNMIAAEPLESLYDFQLS